jgi:hypothetical protein
MTMFHVYVFFKQTIEKSQVPGDGQTRVIKDGTLVFRSHGNKEDYLSLSLSLPLSTNATNMPHKRLFFLG